MNRLQSVLDLATRFTELNHVVVVAMDREVWMEALSSRSDRYLGNELRYGWTTPFEDEESPTGMSVALCPEIIIEQSQSDSDNRFVKYLEAIEYRLNYQFAYFGDDDKVNKIDEMLYDEAPGSLDVLNTVQLRVLDQEANANGQSSP